MSQNRIQRLEEMLKSEPGNALFQYTLGVEYLKGKSYQKAVIYLQEAVRLKPAFSAAYRELGKALEKRDAAQEAAQAYQKGIAIAEEQGDIQTAKEMRIFLKRLANR